jgi:putative transposase
LSPSEQKRHIKGIAIASFESSIKRINKLRYRVRSQSDVEKWYDVVKEYGHNLGGHQDGKWTCTCADYLYRGIICKHIYAVSISKELRKRIVQEEFQPSSLPVSIECLRCRSTLISKDGRRNNKSGFAQKYLCKACSYRFVSNIGFEHSQKNPKVICASIDLYFKGVSLRKIAHHIKQFYDVEIHNTSVLRWVRRFGEVVSQFVDNLSPKTSGIFHVDEMMIHVRRERMEIGHYQWLWNLMDDTTRFWISSMVSQRRELNDAREVFKDAKRKTKIPKAIIHDGLPSYDGAFQKEFYTAKNPRVRNIRSISVRNQGLNSKVERLNGTMRDREKVMRGMQLRETAQQIVDAMRIHYNFVREHQTLETTPAEKAGIRLDLKNNKVENLIRLAATFKRV